MDRTLRQLGRSCPRRRARRRGACVPGCRFSGDGNPGGFSAGGSPGTRGVLTHRPRWRSVGDEASMEKRVGLQPAQSPKGSASVGCGWGRPEQGTGCFLGKGCFLGLWVETCRFHPSANTVSPCGLGMLLCLCGPQFPHLERGSDGSLCLMTRGSLVQARGTVLGRGRWSSWFRWYGLASRVSLGLGAACRGRFTLRLESRHFDFILNLGTRMVAPFL